MTNEEMESCLDTIGVYRSVLSFMNVANKDSREDRDMHIENLDKLEKMLCAEWKNKKVPTALDHIHNVVRDDAYRRGYEQGKADAAPKWIPVTPETLPEEGKVVVAYGDGKTWDVGMYKGHGDDITFWHWKKNTFKRVYWWMYKKDALPGQWEGEQH